MKHRIQGISAYVRPLTMVMAVCLFLSTQQSASAQLLAIKCPTCCGPCKLYIVGIGIEIGCGGACNDTCGNGSGACTTVGNPIGFGVQRQCPG